MKSYLLLQILVFALVVPNLGCSGDEVKAEDSASTTPETDPTYEGVGDSTALYLNISTAWTGATTYQSFKTCEVSSLDASPDKTCTVTIPEGQLYYSDVKFTIGTKLASQCPIIDFQPYYYRRSKSDTYTPPGSETELKCLTDDNDDPLCFGGAAPQLVPDFMKKNDSLYFVTALGAETSYTLKSENSIRWYQGSKVNYLAANNLEDRTLDIPAKSFVADSMVDYEIVCRNLWYDHLFSIKLTIGDQDTETAEGVNDEIDDWDSMTP